MYLFVKNAISESKGLDHVVETSRIKLCWVAFPGVISVRFWCHFLEFPAITEASLQATEGGNS